MIDLESIQHELSSDYSLSIYFSRRFPKIDGPPFSPYKPLQNVDFSRGRQHAVFFRNCTHILTRTQAKKFEEMFLVKIASKGASLMVLLLIVMFSSRVGQSLWCKSSGGRIY